MTDMMFFLLYIIIDILSIIGFFLISFFCFYRFSNWKFTPLIFIAFGLLISSLGIIFDLLGRFLPESQSILADLFLRAAGSIFYLGSFLILRGIISTRGKVPWDRLILYGAIYAAMITIYLTPEYVFMSYDSELEVWRVLSIENNFMLVLNILTTLPTIDIFFIIIKKVYTRSIDYRSRKEFISFSIGIILPIIGSTIMLLNTSSYGLLIANLLLLMGITFSGIAFGINPLVIAISSSEPLQLIIVSKEVDSFSLISCEWKKIEGELDMDLIAAALSGTGGLFGEITQEKKKEISILSRVQLGGKEIFSVEGNMLIAYFISIEPDKICKAAIKRIIGILENHFLRPGMNLHEINLISKSEFINVVNNVFTFTTAI